MSLTHTMLAGWPLRRKRFDLLQARHRRDQLALERDLIRAEIHKALQLPRHIDRRLKVGALKRRCNGVINDYHDAAARASRLAQELARVA